jgi:hypothetical protein
VTARAELAQRWARFAGRWPWLAARLPTVGRFLLLDVILAAAAYLALAPRLVPKLLADVHHSIHPGYLEGVPSDFQGTAWFYWWYQQAVARGVDIVHPDMVCAPTGQALGQNFPQQIDALVAQPFLAWAPFPGSFNLFMVATLVISAWAGHIGLRAITRSWLAAFVGGGLYGFSAFGISQLIAGRPTVALVATLPLFVACWLRTLEARGGARWAWAVVAGLVAALAVQHYVLYAGLLLLFGVLAGLLRALVPARGVSRWRPLVAALLVGGIGLSVSTPYLQGLLQRRPITERPADRLADGHALDPRTWVSVGAELAKALGQGDRGARRPAPSLAGHEIQGMQRDAVPVSFLWGEVERARPPPAYLPPVLLIAALVLLPFGRLRSLAWLAATLVFYSLALGPAACHALESELAWVTLGGRTLPMPSYLMIWKLPWTAQLWHPVRATPMVLLCLLAAVVVGLDAATRFARAQADERLGRAWLGHLFMAAVVMGLGVLGARQLLAVGGLEMSPSPWEPHPYLQRLASEEGDFAVIDLPLGLGHGLGVGQLVHQRPRANSHHDDLSALLEGRAPPDDCYRLPLLRGIWDLQIQARGQQPTQQGSLDAIAGSTDAAAVRQAAEAGFRYVLLFRRGFHKLETQHNDRVQRQTISSLRRILGPPSYSDEDLLVWTLEPTPDGEPTTDEPGDRRVD